MAINHCKFHVNLRKNFFTLRVAYHWNRLPGRSWSPSLQTFQSRLVPVGGTISGGARGRERRPLRAGAAAAARSLRQVAGAGRTGPAAAPGAGPCLCLRASPLPPAVRRAAVLALTCSVHRAVLCSALPHPAPGKRDQAWGNHWEHLPPAAARPGTDDTAPTTLTASSGKQKQSKQTKTIYHHHHKTHLL